MDAERIIDRMALFPAGVRAQLSGLSDHDLRWKPSESQWSLLEVLRHLGDEEAEDFRTRLRLTLEEPETDWPPIDPEGVAVARQYNEADPLEALEQFERERERSITWLRSMLPTADWNLAHTHPKFGPMTAGLLLASWAAHDQLHLRQIARRCFDLVQRDAGDYSTIYAGEWPDAR